MPTFDFAYNREMIITKIKNCILIYDLQNVIIPLIWCFDTYPILSVILCLLAAAYAIPVIVFLAFGVTTVLITFIGFLIMEGAILTGAFIFLMSVLSALTLVIGISLFISWILYILLLQLCEFATAETRTTSENSFNNNRIDYSFQEREE